MVNDKEKDISKHKSSKELFGSMNLKELDKVYSVIARGAQPGVCDDWKKEIESAVDTHIDNYQKSTASKKKEIDK